MFSNVFIRVLKRFLYPCFKKTVLKQPTLNRMDYNLGFIIPS